MRDRKTGSCLMAAIGVTALFFFLALGYFLYAMTDAELYNKLQKEMDLYDEVGVGEEDLRLVMGNISSYLKDETDALNREVTMYGQRQMVFNERELAHMVDVKALFVLGRNVVWGLSAVALVGLAGFVMLTRRHAAGRLFGAAGWLIFLLALAAGAIWCCQPDFTSLFIKFHQIFFTNDLWLLNPETDAMIRMFPENFFFGMVVAYLQRVGWVVLGGGTAILLMTLLFQRLVSRVAEKRTNR